MSDLIALGIKAALVAAVLGAIAYGFHEFEQKYYVEPAIAKQIAKDQPVVDAANARAATAQKQLEDAKADTKSCVDQAKIQSQATLDAQAEAARAKAATHAITVAANLDEAKRAAEFNKLKAIAAAKPVANQSCEDSLSKGDATLRPALKDRQAK